MRVVWIAVDGVRHEVPKRDMLGGAVKVEACQCGVEFIQGRGSHIADDDRHYSAQAHCLGCGVHRGELQVWPSTLFGLHEDEAVLNGRCRVY